LLAAHNLEGTSNTTIMSIAEAHVNASCLDPSDVSDSGSFHSAVEYQTKQRKKRRIEQDCLPSLQSHCVSKGSGSRRMSSVSTTSKGKREDLLSLHRKSCQLFSSPDGTLQHNQSLPEFSPPSSASLRRHSDLEHSRNSCTTDMPSLPSSHVSAQASQRPSLCQPESNGETERPRTHVSSVTSWTSVETRRREYEKIDRAHSGMRGVFKALMPTCWHRSSWRKDFFHGKCDGSSVRRLRLQLPEDRTLEKRPKASWRFMSL